MTRNNRDVFTRWVDEHPATVYYIAVVITLLLAVQVYQFTSS